MRPVPRLVLALSVLGGSMCRLESFPSEEYLEPAMFDELLWFFGGTNTLHVLPGASAFSERALAQLHMTGKSIQVLDGSSPVKPGTQLVYISEAASGAQKKFLDHDGPSYLVMNIRQNIADSVPELFLKANVEVFTITNSSKAYTIDKESLSWVQVFPQPNQNRDQNYLSDPRHRRVSVSTFNCSIFSLNGKLQSDGHPEWSDGVEMLMFVEMARRLNLNWSVSFSAGFGNLLSNGSWDGGLHGALASGEKDLGFCSIWIFPEDVNRIEMVSPHYLYCLTFVVPRPKILKFNWVTIFKTYSLNVWFGFVVSILGTIVIYETISNVRLRFQNERRCYKSDVNFYKIIVALTRIDYPKPEKVTGSLRPLVSSWTILGLLFAVGYSSNLASVLTRPMYSEKLRSVEDLVTAECPWGMNSYPENLNKFKKEQESIFEKFYSLYIGDVDVNKKRGIMRKGCYAEVGESVGNLFFVTNEVPPNFYNNHEASEYCLYSHLFSFLLKKGSPLASPFREATLRIIETGVMQKIFSDILISNRLQHLVVRKVYTFTRISSKMTHFSKLSLNSLQGVFYLYGCCLCLCFVIFIAEIFFYNINRRIPFKN